tara:strand:- start:25 stop:1113 length:1089 start_codon:yes stop_codon:yes gene_type:complete
MTIYAIDWSYKKEKRAFHSAEGALNKEPKFQDGDIIATENMPHHKVVELHNEGCLIYRCGTHLTKKVREEKSIKKTDKNDAKIIYDEFISFNQNPEDQETFRKFDYNPKLEQLSYLNKTLKDFIEVRRKMKQRFKSDPNIKNVELPDFIVDKDTGEKTAKTYGDRLDDLEKEIRKYERAIEKKLMDFPIYSTYLKDVGGIGSTTAADIICAIKDISRFATLGKLNAYVGFDVRNGKAPKKIAGQTANWNHSLKSVLLHNYVTCGVIKQAKCIINKEEIAEAKAFNKINKKNKKDIPETVKGKSKQRLKYEEIKEYEQSKNESSETPVNGMQLELRVKRKVAKLLLKELYNKWKALQKEGIDG